MFITLITLASPLAPLNLNYVLKTYFKHLILYYIIII